MIKDMPRVRMTQTEVTSDFSAVLEKLRQGSDVVVEQEERPIAIISALKGPGRPIDECIALAKARGSSATLDEDFAQDLEKIIAERKPMVVPAWD